MLYNVKAKESKRVELKRILRLRLQEKYGLCPQDYICDRLEEEWRAAESLGLLEHIFVLEKLVGWLNKKQYPYWLRGAAGSSLLLYLLGITRSNPLPPHYYCPCCKNVLWMVGCKDGFDLVDTQLCKDKTVMVNDGHDLPWQNIWGVKKGYLEIDLPKQLYGFISRYYSIYYGQQKYKDIDILDPTGEKMVRSAKLRICCILDLEYERDVLKEYLGLAPEKQSWFAFWKFVGKEIEPDRAINFPCKTFSDILALKGLSLSEGAWDREAKAMLTSGKYQPSDLIAFREDVFYFLRKAGFTEAKAWLATKNVITGYGLRSITEEITTASESWKLERCQKILYLFSKATLVEYMLFKLHMLELSGKSKLG